MIANVVHINTNAIAGEPPQDARRSDAQRWAVLMGQAQDGDARAYQRLLTEITPYLRSIALRTLGGSSEVEDAVQDILLIVHRIRHTFERDRPFTPWLSTIAQRRLTDHLRRRAHRLRYELPPLDELPDAASDGADPDEQVARSQHSGNVRDAVSRLAPRQREAVELLKLQELSLEEASQRSGQSVSALKVACHRALHSLRGVLHRN